MNFENNWSFMFKPAMAETLVDLAMTVVPVWVAVMIGLIVGWAWRPRWASFFIVGVRSFTPPGLGALLTAFLGFPLLGNLWAFCRLKKKSADAHDDVVPQTGTSPTSSESISHGVEETLPLTNEDLNDFCKLLDDTDGGPAWHQVMNRTTPTMTYQAWRRDPEAGPPQYRSRTVYENLEPEFMRDFFWDDEFRVKWDDMLLYSKTLEQCENTGAMTVHWVRKFPFFCSDREYIIARRIWEAGRTYFCITKGVPHPSVPRRAKPRRVDLYYSSWLIRPVPSREGDGNSACEVLLFHYEDMGIPWEIAKLGVRQGMWGAVKNIERGINAYKRERNTGSALSNSASMARICSKMPTNISENIESTSTGLEDENNPPKSTQGNGWKLVVIGGAVALACGLDRGLVSKMLIFGVARRLGKFGKRL